MTKPKAIKYRAYVIWTIAALFYMYENIIQVSQSIIVPELMQHFSINAKTLSFKLGSSFLITYSLFQFFIGYVIDKYKVNIVLAISILICAISVISYALSSNVDQAMISRLFLGFGAAFAAIGSLKITSIWFKNEQFATMTGLLLSFGMLGSILGEMPLLSLFDKFGWISIYKIIGYVGILLSLVALVFIKHKEKNKQISNSDKVSIKALRDIIKQKQVWIVALYGMLMFTPILLLGNMWGPSFISTVYHQSKQLSTSEFQMIFAGFIVGAPLFGWYSDKIKKRKTPLLISTLGSFVAIMLLLFIRIENYYYISFIFMILGFFTSAFLPSFSIMKEINSKSLTGSSIGLMNTINTIGGPIMISITGYIINTHSQDKYHDVVLKNSGKSFIFALSIIPLMYFIALILLYYIKETNCINKD